MNINREQLDYSSLIIGRKHTIKQILFPVINSQMLTVFSNLFCGECLVKAPRNVCSEIFNNNRQQGRGSLLLLAFIVLCVIYAWTAIAGAESG